MLVILQCIRTVCGIFLDRLQSSQNELVEAHLKVMEDAYENLCILGLVDQIALP